jgi:hypothetical protein
MSSVHASQRADRSPTNRDVEGGRILNRRSGARHQIGGSPTRPDLSCAACPVPAKGTEGSNPPPSSPPAESPRTLGPSFGDRLPAFRVIWRKRVAVVDYPDGRLAIRYRGLDLPYTTFDKLRQVSQATVRNQKSSWQAFARAGRSGHQSPQTKPGFTSGTKAVAARCGLAASFRTFGREPAPRRHPLAHPRAADRRKPHSNPWSPGYGGAQRAR